MANFNELAQYVIGGNEPKVKELTNTFINDGVAPFEIIQNGLIAGMNVVGERFKEGDMYVPEVMMSARAMNSGLALVKPLLKAGEIQSKGTVVIGTVKGDLHDIGKNLVAMMLESDGFTVINIGTDVTPDKFVNCIKENNATVLAMSAMLTTTMLSMKDTISLLEKEGLRDKVKVMIGGAPVSQVYASEINADGYSADASAAVELANKLVS